MREKRNKSYNEMTCKLDVTPHVTPAHNNLIYFYKTKLNSL